MLFQVRERKVAELLLSRVNQVRGKGILIGMQFQKKPRQSSILECESGIGCQLVIKKTVLHMQRWDTLYEVVGKWCHSVPPSLVNCLVPEANENSLLLA